MRRSREISPAKHVHLLSARIVAFDGLYGLMDGVFKIALKMEFQTQIKAVN
jgi:hypothetical protein